MSIAVGCGQSTAWLILAGLALLVGPGCVGLRPPATRHQSSEQTTYTLWVGPFAVRTLAPLDEDGVEAEALREVTEEIEAVLGSQPVHDPIEVFLFSDQARYEEFLRTQRGRLPFRRALFVQEGARRKVYAYRSSRIARDLKHEAAHALLSVRAGSIVLWLDEGLAEYFEPPRDLAHLQPRHIRELTLLHERRLWTPDIRRLAAIDNVAEFSQRDYAEAWLWCHLLLEGSEETRRMVADGLRRDGGRNLTERLTKRAALWSTRAVEHLAALRTLVEQRQR